MGSHTITGRHKPLYLALRRVLCISAGLTISFFANAETADHEPSCRETVLGQSLCGDQSREGNSGANPKQTAETSTVASGDDEPRVSPTQNLDWVPFEQLTEEEITLAKPNCCGAYVEPDRTYTDAGLEPAKAPLKISADETEAQGDVATLKGDVQVSQGYRQVRSNQAVVNREKRTVDLEGNITYREPGILLTGNKAAVNLESGYVNVKDVTFVLHESSVRGSADSLSRPEENTLYIDNALYTTCEPGNNSWTLRASSVEIDTVTSVATARNVRLNVKDWPVLYLPWLRYPLSGNRATGLLFPNVLTGNDNGLDYAQPIYLNLAPSYDATITPRFIQERGTMAEAEFRHMSRATRTVLSGGYLADDNGGSNNDPLFDGKDRWTNRVEHNGGFGRNWSSLIDYTDVSDIDYFRDVDTATLALSSASHLNQQIRTGYSTDNWDFAIQGQQFETLILDGLEQFRQLPRVDANGHYPLGSTDLELSLKQHYVAFDHTEDDVFGSGIPLTTDARNTTITGNRFRANYSLVWDKDWLWGYFKPRLTTKYISYDLDDPLMGSVDQSPDVFVPVTSLDSGLYFERETPLFPGFVNTLEPRLFYVKSEYEDQSAIPNFDSSDLTFGYYQLFRDDRFSGGDRIGDTEQVTLGMTSRLIDNYTGQEKVRFSIGQVYYIADRKVTLDPAQQEELTRNSSDIAAELGGLLGGNWRYQADILANDEDGIVNKGSIGLRYNNQQDQIFNLSYRYTRRDYVLSGDEFVRSDIDQADVSFAMPVSDSWSILGRYNYDLNTRQELEVFAGLEYNSCCWSISVVGRRWIDRDDNYIVGDEDLAHNNGVFFQIQFRGLAGTGARVNNILSEGIYGYKQQDN